jgi:hypothetical protein
MAVLENTRHDSFAVSNNYLGVSISRDQLAAADGRQLSGLDCAPSVPPCKKSSPALIVRYLDK